MVGAFALHEINEMKNLLSLLYMDNEKIGAKLFGELRNVVLEENGEDKMVREDNK